MLYTGVMSSNHKELKTQIYRSLTTGKSLQWGGFILLFIIALTMQSIFTASSHYARNNSPELGFTDNSTQGFAIVPASCPSDPHDANDCSLPGDDTWTTYCTGATDPNGHFWQWWQVSNQNNYRFLRTGDGICVPPTSCPDGSAVPPGGVCLIQRCPDGSTPINNQCPFTAVCPPGYTLTNGQCVLNTCTTFLGFQIGDCTHITPQCPPPSFAVGSQCVQCASGSTWNGSSCIITSCPAGYTLVGGVCKQDIITQCQPGYVAVNGVCQQQCTLSCQSGNLVNSCNGQVTTCSYGCASNSCIQVPGVTVQTFAAHPAIVKKGQTGTIAWSVTNAKSCTVTGSNGDTWSGLTGNQTTSALTAQTIFTLTCVPLAGSQTQNGSSYVWNDLYQTINIAPIFNEQ
jgi:hypothetical protein